MPGERFDGLKGIVPEELRRALESEVAHPDSALSDAELETIRITETVQIAASAAEAVGSALQGEILSTYNAVHSALGSEVKGINERIDKDISETRAEATGTAEAIGSALQEEIAAAIASVHSALGSEVKGINDRIDKDISETRAEATGTAEAVGSALQEEIAAAISAAHSALAAEANVINDRIGEKYTVSTGDATPTVLATISPGLYKSSKIHAKVVAHRADRLQAAMYEVDALARAIPASSVLTLNSNPGAGETVTLDTTVYTFVVAPPTSAFEVAIGAAATNTLDNLEAAINLTGTPGTEYGPGTTKHPTCTARKASASTIEAIALKPGIAGNAIATTETLIDVLSVWTGATLAGGTNMSLFDDGTPVTTIYEDNAAWNVSIAVSGGGLDVEISGTGVVNTNINWLIEVTLVELS